MAASWDKFDAATTDEERFELTYNSLLQSNNLPFSKQSTTNDVKSKATAIELRNKGNDIFRTDVHIALMFYNRSICSAPYPTTNTDDSTELALAFANRSAVYCRIEKYDAALRDTTYAIKFKYPKHLSYKLYERRGQCFNKIGKLEEAATNFQQALSALPLANNTPADKINDLTSTLKKVKLDAGKGKRQVPDKASRPSPKKTYGQHREIAAASNCLEIKHNTQSGRHIVSTKDLNPGDIIAIEEPYCSVLRPKHYCSHCFHCLKRSDAMIPCKQCDLAMFCSEECRTSSWQQYHQVECPVLAHVIPLNMQTGIKLLALRSLIIACDIKNGKGLAELYETTKFLDEKIHEDETRKGFDRNGQYNSFDYGTIHNLTLHLESKSFMQLASFATTSVSIVNCLESFTDLIPTDLPWPGREGLNWTIFTGMLLVRFMRIAQYNSFRIDESYNTKQITKIGIQKEIVGDGLYSFHSLLNHSCWPNASRFFCDGDTKVMFALLPIKKGEEICIMYAADYKSSVPKKERKFNCEKEWFFTCRCAACTHDWPLYRQLRFDDPKMICSKCGEELVAESYGTLDFLACRRCKETVSTSHYEREMNAIFGKMQQLALEISSIKKPSKDLNSQAASLLGQLLKLCAMPFSPIVDCQELVNKGFYRTMGNYYVAE